MRNGARALDSPNPNRCLVDPAVEAVHMKWVEAINTGDVDAVSKLYEPTAIGIDAFGRQLGVDAKFVQALHSKGITVSFPIDSVQALKGGQAVIAYGTFTSKYTDPNVPPGQGNWIQVFERDGDTWKLRVASSSRAALAAQMK
jgi:ketosteroid isomerase-like protein